MAEKHFATLIWLIPEPASYTPLGLLIADLARRYNAPLFEPHLTLGRVVGQSAESIKIDRGPITLKVIGIFASDVFTKTLFFRFAPTPALDSLRFSLGMMADGYDPHLSLLYCKLRGEEARRLETSIQLAQDKITFDRFSMVRCADPTATRKDVESWERLNTGPLSGT